MIKAIWIDIDNTVLDFDAYVQDAMKVGFARFGLGEYTEETYRIFKSVNSGFWHRLEAGEITYAELLRDRWNAIFAALGITYDGPTFEKYFKAYLFDSAIPVEGAMRLLEHLKGRYVLCVASNGPVEQQRNRLRLAGMLPYFSHCFISEAVGAAKPSAEFFSYGMTEMNRGRACAIEAHEVLMLGDSLTSDMRGAMDCGMQTCWLDRSGKGDAGDLAIGRIVHSLDELLEIL